MMEVLEAGSRLFQFADRHSLNVRELMSRPDFGNNLVDTMVLNHETVMMTLYWQLAASLTKEMTEPLKSIVNK